MKEEAITIRQNTAASRFEATVAGHLCVADYVIEGDRMVFTHTFVAPELRGRGIAGKLVRAGLESAIAKHRKIVPACSYVAAFVKRHKEFRDFLEPDH